LKGAYSRLAFTAFRSGKYSSYRAAEPDIGPRPPRRLPDGTVDPNYDVELERYRERWHAWQREHFTSEGTTGTLNYLVIYRTFCYPALDEFQIAEMPHRHHPGGLVRPGWNVVRHPQDKPYLEHPPTNWRDEPLAEATLTINVTWRYPHGGPLSYGLRWHLAYRDGRSYRHAETGAHPHPVTNN